MIRSRAATAWFLAWAGLVFLSFRPLAPLERALGVLLAPLRFAAELAAPLELLQLGAVSAAEEELARGARSEAEEGERTLAALAARAMPADPVLLAERRFVHGEVVERASGKPDRCRVSVRDLRGVEPGSPVACGDTYVGRVAETERQGYATGGSAWIELVTGRDFRVGARLLDGERGALAADEEIFFTVGGLVAERSRPLVRLAVHQPSSSMPEGGVARVHELFAEEGEQAELAEGFLLGTVRSSHGSSWIEPVLDYQDGLFQVVIVTRAAPELSEVPPFEPALRDSSWLATRALTLGDPGPWRSTLKIPAGSREGVREGAAVTGIGGRLVGRVARVGLFASDVALLGDPGFTLTAIARLEGESETRILGRLVSGGRAADGALRFRWSVRLPLHAGEANETRETVLAWLYSGSGAPGLPAGLYLGETRLPSSASPGEELELELRTPVEPSDVRQLFVRRPEPGPGARP